MKVAFLGYGNVNRALHALIERRGAQVDAEVVAVASRSRGWTVGDRVCTDIDEWLEVARPDVVFEAIPLDPHAGQPAVDYLRAILASGADAISANKGPIVYAYRVLTYSQPDS